jgi:hypothetical protein
MKDINILIDFMNNELDERKSLQIKDRLSRTQSSEHQELMKIDSMLDEYVGNIQVPEGLTHKVLNSSKEVVKQKKSRKSQGFITVFTSYVNNTAINYFSTLFNVVLLVSSVAIPLSYMDKEITISTNPPVIKINNQLIEDKKIADTDEHETKVTYLHTKHEVSENLTEIKQKEE